MLLQEYIIFICIYIYIHIYIHTYINIYIYSLDFFLHCIKFIGMHDYYASYDIFLFACVSSTSFLMSSPWEQRGFISESLSRPQAAINQLVCPCRAQEKMKQNKKNQTGDSLSSVSACHHLSPSVLFSTRWINSCMWADSPSANY